ncbi:hypothetical protein FGO68_gene6070 [Halteria grandinella]|uniref:Uncharacterized protein n=1 Tax=Halteria grandinella TaxID=5974 RepID=A0A8J8T5P6_HALGN|nr:hypothetical protein FGO68_gene6070 [Halteria grandinella]
MGFKTKQELIAYLPHLSPSELIKIGLPKAEATAIMKHCNNTQPKRTGSRMFPRLAIKYLTLQIIGYAFVQPEEVDLGYLCRSYKLLLIRNYQLFQKGVYKQRRRLSNLYLSYSMIDGSPKDIGQLITAMIMRRMWLTAWPCLVTDFTSTKFKSSNHFYTCLASVDQQKCGQMIAKISVNYSKTCLLQSMIQHQTSNRQNPLKVNVAIILENIGSQNYQIAKRLCIF